MAKTAHNTVETEFPKFPDYTQYLADYSRMFGDFGKMFVNGKAPAVDFEAVASAQRKNLEAMVAANRVAMEGCQAAFQRQAELARELADEFLSVNKALVAAGSPEDKFAKQATVCKQAFEGTLSNAREFATMIQKTGNEAVDLISKRVVENFDEAQAIFAAKSPKKTAA
jgi:phasin family protein